MRRRTNGGDARLAALTAVAGSTLVVAFLILFYAIASLTPIRTWDDAGYRMFASNEAPGVTVPTVLRTMLMPNPRNELPDSRTAGYHWCLVLGLKVLGGLGAERAWQLVNVILLVIQLGCVYGLAHWSLRDSRLALAATVAYLLTPVVFGMSRWVLTENFVMAGLWVTIYGTATLLAADGQRRWWSWKEVVQPLVAGVCIGIFATMREYALPLQIALVAAATLGLLINRRWLAVWFFVAACAPYQMAAYTAAKPAFDNAQSRVAGATFFHPLSAWFPHIVMESWGPFMTLAMVGGLVAVMWSAPRSVLRRRRAAVSDRRAQPWWGGLFVLGMTSGLLSVGMLVAVMVNQYRLVRPTIPIMILWLGFLLIGVRLFDVPVERHKSVLAAYFLVVVLGSVCIEYYHLFVRFDRGRSFVHRPTAMEYIDYPLVLRPLADPTDMHIGPDLP